MTKLAVYEISTGLIRWNTSCPDGMEGVQTEDLEELDHIVVTEEANGRTHYVSGGVLTARPALTFNKLAIDADDVDAAVLSLTVPFEAEIDGQVFQIDEADGAGDYVLELSSPMPATYRVRVRLWPYQDYDAEVVAT